MDYTLQKKMEESFKSNADKIALEHDGLHITYKELNNRSNHIANWLNQENITQGEIIGLLFSDRVNFITALIGVLKARCVFLPIDTKSNELQIKFNVTDSSCDYVLFDNESEQKKLSFLKLNFINIKDIYSAKLPTDDITIMNYSPEDIIYLYNTTGTTREPKSVVGKNKSIFHYIDWQINNFKINDSYIISQFINISFDAILRDIFVPLLSGGRACIPSSEYLILEPSKIQKWIDKHQISLIHCTPSVFQNINTSTLHPNRFRGLKYILLSGERVIPKQLKNWYSIFNERIKIINIYGATETTLVKSFYEVQKEDVIKERISIGEPIKGAQFFILNEKMEFCSKGHKGEIYIRTPYSTYGYLNNPELTINKFIPNPYSKVGNDFLYRTGDLGLLIKENEFELFGRIDNNVKIRGIRIEIEPIENIILEFDGIHSVSVCSKEDDLGQISLVAYYVASKTIQKDELISYLQKKLSRNYIPSFFVQLDKFPLNQNGKLDTKAFPAPTVAKRKIVENLNQSEQILLDACCEILNLDKNCVSIEDNFFALGGDSLKAGKLAAKLYDEQKTELPIAKIFTIPSLRTLAEYIESLTLRKPVNIIKTEKKEYYKIPHIQHGIYNLQNKDKNSILYNMPKVWKVNGDLDLGQLTNWLKLFIRRHKNLRTGFKVEGNSVVQFLVDDFEFFVEYQEIEASKLSDELIFDFPEVINFVRPFDLEKPPLMRSRLIKNKIGCTYLILDFHHIIADGASLSILFKEFIILFGGDELKKIKYDYFDYSEMWDRNKPVLENQRKFWLDYFKDGYNGNYLYALKSNSLAKNYKTFGKTHRFCLSVEKTNLIKNIAQEAKTSLFTVLYSVLGILFYKLTNQNEILIGISRNLREASYSEILGYFINILPIKVSFNKNSGFISHLESVKNNIHNSINNQEWPIEEIINGLDEFYKKDEQKFIEVVFDYQENIENEVHTKELRLKNIPNDKRTSKFDLCIYAKEINNYLEFQIDYRNDLFRDEIIQKLGERFKIIIDAVSEDCDVSLGKISILTNDEKQKYLFEKQGALSTCGDYDIIERLIGNANKYSDKIAVKYKDKSLSYKELYQNALTLSKHLIANGVSNDSIVALIQDKSIGMVISILAVKMARGAYLPIDPNLPGKRILYMLKDSNPELILMDQDTHQSEIYELIIKKKKEVYKTKPRPSISDLDLLTLPNRDHININKYNNYVGMAFVKHKIIIQATRGCPYKCAYCHDIWEKKHFYRSAIHIFEEIKHYYEKGYRRFVFIDDIFNLNRNNSLAFFKLIIENDLKIQMFFPNGVRGDILTKEYIDVMVKAGTVNIAFALESASPRIQQLIQKNLNLDRFKENINYVVKTYPHVIVDLFMMHGFPSETHEEAKATLDFIKDIKWLHFPYLHILKIFPGSRMEKLAIENGISLDQIINSKELSYQEIPDTIPFQKKFTRYFQSWLLDFYFLNKERLLKVLPQQFIVMTESEIVKKYDSYLPIKINSYSQLLSALSITEQELNYFKPLPDDTFNIDSVNDSKSKGDYGNVVGADSFRILLIDLSQNYSSNALDQYDVVEEPLGLMYIKSYLLKEYNKKVDVRIIKARVDFDCDNDLVEILSNIKPELIGVRTISFYSKFFHDKVKIIKSNNVSIPIVAGGPYATSEYHNILMDDNIDIAVLGEGEVTFSELIGAILKNSKRLPSLDQLENIEGIAFVNRTIVDGPYKVLNVNNVDLNNDLYPELKLEKANPVDIAYIIYTSGSTGNPKGVAIENRNINSLMAQTTDYFNISSNEVWTMFHNYGFDFSVWEIYGSLIFGNELIIVPNGITKNPEIFIDLLERESITILNQTPSAFSNIQIPLKKEKRDSLNLKYIVFGGEQLNPSMLKNWHVNFPDIKFINMYGITETTVHVTFKELNAEDFESSVSTMGKPLNSLQVYLLDNDLQFVPQGITGEIFVSGKGVSRGYINNPELTYERFIKNPFRGNDILYKSGDTARMLFTEDFEYIGRNDSQVKIRGYRIELGEIEKVLLKHEAIKMAKAIIDKDIHGGTKICAYLILNDKIEHTQLVDYSKKYLPHYMIPKDWLKVDRVPINKNGKMDYDELKALGTKIEAQVTNPYFLRNDMERKIIEVWKELLGLQEIGIDDNFFDVGGNSSLVINLKNKLDQEIGINFNLVDLFKYTTIKQFIDYINEEDLVNRKGNKNEVDQGSLVDSLNLFS